MKNLDKYRGCLIGGAAGDALGYPIEFFDTSFIFERYGDSGITEYKLTNGIAEISDDTQMTLFTAAGLLNCAAEGHADGSAECCLDYIGRSYKDWYCTQTEEYPPNERLRFSWLVNDPRLFERRAPGNTCISVTGGNTYGSVQNPINQSKGCGGIMRAAPIGLYFDDAEKADRIGAEAAALTHGHELGYIPAAALVHIIRLLSHHDGISLPDAVTDMRESIMAQFPSAQSLQVMIGLIDKAVMLSEDDIDDLDAIRQLGQGWVAEETLAIALYCALKYPNDFDKALIASVNHGGDSDSTGAVTGNILGAYLGLQGIPDKYLKNLELSDVILELADDLHSACGADEAWRRKYIDHSFLPSDIKYRRCEPSEIKAAASKNPD